MASKYPEFVPVLKAKDFCRGTYGVGRQRHCLLGWVGDVMCGSAADAPYVEETHPRACRAIEAAARELGARASGGPVVRINDDESNPKRLLADIWNLAMRKLGYTEVVDA